MTARFILAWLVFAVCSSARAAAESCEYAIELEAVRGRCCGMQVMPGQFLQTPIDLNVNHASISAARTQVSFELVFQTFLSLSLTAVETALSQEEAEEREGKVNIPVGLPMVIQLADESTITLTSSFIVETEPPTRIDPPGQLFNTGKHYRVSHMTGASYILNDEQIAALRAQPAIKLQVTTTEGDFDLVVHPSRSDRIQYLLGCV